jgi:hypothetical protein
MFFVFFSRTKNEISQLAEKRENRSQNRNLMAENDSGRLFTLGEFSVSSKINYFLRGEVGGTWWEEGVRGL